MSTQVWIRQNLKVTMSQLIDLFAGKSAMNANLYFTLPMRMVGCSGVDESSSVSTNNSVKTHAQHTPMFTMDFGGVHVFSK